MPTTVLIRMLGNQWEYEFDQEYEVDIAKANQLTGMGMAVLVQTAPVESAPAADMEE